MKVWCDCFVEPLEGNPPMVTVTNRENKLKKVQSFSASWRIDKQKKLNKTTKYPNKWEEYPQCSTAEREIFLNSALESNTAWSCFQEKTVASTENY
jgi:hypothetical protein